jgi:O-antigen ligase
MLLMQSRIGIVGLLFILAATGLYYLKLKTNFFKIGLAVYLLLGSVSFFVANDKISGFISDDTRVAYINIAISYIQDNIWWGSGYRQQRMVLEQQAILMKDQLPPSVFPHIDHRIGYVHNQFLGDMVQFGIWGLIALLLMLFAIARYAIKSRSYLLQMLLMTVILFMLIEEPLYIETGTIRFMAFLVFFVAISESNELKNSLLLRSTTKKEKT